MITNEQMRTPGYEIIEMERIRLLNSTLQDDKDDNSGNDKDDSCGINPDYDSEWSLDSAQLSHSNANS
ncbi:hypothetical protein J1N35_039186 [Gossypium stocksii]|uniref:Uncharacterized protein n=1 Tax=Gossypium stocksii TaxID=47602 RepID=A0A9D3UNB0_9ROSI|nr:hypothetical protein J1N35_039186 [Gossypium stocksii]